MLCDKCKKNEATIHVKKVTNGKIESLHLCAGCARENEDHGVLGAFGFNLAEVLFNIGEMNKSPENAAEEENAPAQENTLRCPVCSWDVQKLQKNNGKLGCPECYKSFSGIIGDALNHIQRGGVHLGKRAGCADPLANAAALRIEIERTRKEQAEFIRKEEYEKAAVCRDRIAELTEKLKTLEQTEQA